MHITEKSLIQSINSDLAEKGFGIVSDWEMKKYAKAAREEYVQSLTKYETSPPKQRFHYSDLINKPHRKYAIGSKNGNGDPYPQLLQTTYISKDHEDFPNLGKVFSYMINLRNTILDLNPDFGNDPARDGWWNACRIHHYPPGGGFMYAHRDTHFPSLLEKSGFPFLQMLVILSTRNKDFSTGGGYVVTRDDEKIYYEDENSFGNIVFFDGSIIHGVDDIDAEKLIDFKTPKGRVAGFVNQYKVLD